MRNLIVFLVLIGLPGCSLLPMLLADPLENQVAECLAFGGSPAYTKAGDARTYQCTR